MILYSNTYRDFQYDGSHLTLTSSIIQEYERVFHRAPNPKEINSWNNSLKCMQLAMSNAELSDDCGVLIEYNLPNTSRRIDFVVTGENEQRRKHVVIVELKQWQKAESTHMDGVVRTLIGNGLHETSHPSYQAFGYKRFLYDFNEEFHSGNMDAKACAFLHNYQQSEPEPLLEDVYSQYVNAAPIFFQDSIDKLAHFISSHVGRGKGMDILYALENGRIRPSMKLIDAVGSLFKGNEYFTLIDEQKVLYEKLLHAPITDNKQVVAIHGGPGTGKSVLSFNLLYGMLKRQKNVVLAAPNAAFRDVMKAKLQQAGFKRTGKKTSDSMVLNSIISGSSSFLGL
ncbi:MAG: DNA/RNA helicase domain-containing protein, partial [Spirochaetota bacterium]